MAPGPCHHVGNLPQVLEHDQHVAIDLCATEHIAHQFRRGSIPPVVTALESHVRPI
jgi:hypothetical protein